VSGHPSAAGRAQDRERPPAKDRRSSTEPTPPTEITVNGRHRTSHALIVRVRTCKRHWSACRHDSTFFVFYSGNVDVTANDNLTLRYIEKAHISRRHATTAHFKISLYDFDVVTHSNPNPSQTGSFCA